VPGLSVAPDVAPELRELSRRLLPETDEVGTRMAERICAEIPLYAEGQLVTYDQLTASCRDNTGYILGQLAGEPRVSIQAPRATGTTRADQGVPYAAVLQAFRVGSRFLWELLVERADPQDREVLLLAAADIWAVSDELASQVTEAYRAAVADKVRRDSQMRSVLVGSLLNGDPTAEEGFTESAAALHLPHTGHYVVVSAECPTPGGEALHDVEKLLRQHNVTSAWRLDHEHHDGLVELRHGFDVSRLVEVLAALAQARVGLSTVVHSVADAPEAQRQARLACAAGTPLSNAVLRFDEQPLPVLLASTPDQSTALARAVLGPLLELSAEDRRPLLETARTWLTADGSTSKAATQLHLHRNTVRYRLRRLEELTGRDLTKPLDAAQIYVALESSRILGIDKARDA
jgi:hypothetical protein